MIKLLHSGICIYLCLFSFLAAIAKHLLHGCAIAKAETFLDFGQVYKPENTRNLYDVMMVEFFEVNNNR